MKLSISFCSLLMATVLYAHINISNAATLNNVCPRPVQGSLIENPPQTKSFAGVLSTTLVAHNSGTGPETPSNNYDYRFCLLEHDNPKRDAPLLRVNPADTVHLKLINKMSMQDGFPMPHIHASGQLCLAQKDLSLASITSMNLHYHGLNIAPLCAMDDVLNTIIQPKDDSAENAYKFDYQFQIPANEPPGLYWYHPHIHGTAQQQLLGGMSGLIIIEGMSDFFPELATMPEQVLILRDIDKHNPAEDDAPDTLEPWKNVSLNSIPIIYGSKQLPKLKMAAGERQFWRVANASADTHFILQFQFKTANTWHAQDLEVVARDGMPLSDDNGLPLAQKQVVKQIVLPPAGRAEFIVTAPTVGIKARLYSKNYNQYLKAKNSNCSASFPSSVCDNTDNNPARTLATIITTPASLTPSTPKLKATGKLKRFTQLAEQTISQSRTLFFTKDSSDDGNFFITPAGNIPKAFDMTAPPDISVQGPTVEEWMIENRDNESHVFHIHQIHFRVMAIDGVATNNRVEHVLRDTLEMGSCRKWADGIDPENDPYGINFPTDSPLNDAKFTGKNCLQPATVKLRMDFRDRNIVGTFLYHCHVLEHEDHGMMAKIEVK